MGKSAIAFLREAVAGFPFRLSHMLTDNGSCFTPTFATACTQLGAEYRHTRPRTPQTNGMVERFNGRIGSEVLGITIHSHRDLEQLLRGSNAAYNDRRQRVLDGVGAWRPAETAEFLSHAAQRRIDTGLASRIMRLSTWTARATSPP